VKIIALIGLLAYISLLVLLFHNSQNKLRQDADLVLKRANSQSASLIRHFLDEEIEFSEKYLKAQR